MTNNCILLLIQAAVQNNILNYILGTRDGRIDEQFWKECKSVCLSKVLAVLNAIHLSVLAPVSDTIFGCAYNIFQLIQAHFGKYSCRQRTKSSITDYLSLASSNN